MNRNEVAAIQKAVLEVSRRIEDVKTNSLDAVGEVMTSLKHQGVDLPFDGFKVGDRVKYTDNPGADLSPGIIVEVDKSERPESPFRVKWDDGEDDWFSSWQLRLLTELERLQSFMACNLKLKKVDLTE